MSASPGKSSTEEHTITIEPHTTYPGGICQLAVIERYDGMLITVCCREDQIRPGHTLAEEALKYARMYDAEYVAGGAR